MDKSNCYSRNPFTAKGTLDNWSTARCKFLFHWIYDGILYFAISKGDSHYSMTDIEERSFQEESRLHWDADTSSLNDPISYLLYYKESYDNDLDKFYCFISVIGQSKVTCMYITIQQCISVLKIISEICFTSW